MPEPVPHLSEPGAAASPTAAGGPRPGSAPTAGALPRPLASTVVVLASAVVLVLEVVSIRLVAPYVGNTLETYTAAIGVALAGIATGATTGGRLADLVDPRRFLGLLLGIGGALLLATRPVVVLLGPELGIGPAAVVVLMLAAVFLPATVLSAVPPAVVKLQLTGLRNAGSVVGRLSALGTAGALAGTFLTGFVLLAHLRTSTILLVCGLLMLLSGVGLHVYLRGRRAARSTLPVVVVGLLVAGLLVGLPGPCQQESAYYCIRVQDDGAQRTLFLDDLRHASVVEEDPSDLRFRYTRRFGDVADVAFPDGQRVDALHLGGGGFTFPRWLQATHPGSSSQVLELDPTVLETARDQLGLEPGPDLRVRLGDARTGVQEQPSGAYDLVVGDAFGAVSVPWHLATRDFYAEAKRTMRPGGVFVLNVIDFPPNDLAAAQVATLREEFGEVALIVTAEERDDSDGGNFVVVASDRPLDLAGLSDLVGVEGDGVLAGEELTDWTGDAPVLTDDRAPVDQLITPYQGPRG